MSDHQETPPLPSGRSPRLAVRAILRDADRLLLVNAWPGPHSDLWCAPGGGAEPGLSLPDNLAREVSEETGLLITVGAPCLVNEFHDPGSGFHQVEIFFRCRLVGGTLSENWRDPEGIVMRRRWVTRSEMNDLRVKPDALAAAAWGDGILYDPLEDLVR
ncbi:NUDIX domain-containing protein [Tropicimonas sp. IMCC6043]|uniref:NUDIX domain-containing protein n=1 Tax=Tropicimonas sp. IMCC6043 TaxID=2510645 RepID=UPI00101CA605|nr:NUDIX hydrolase [Tropicimonas sp. IMCC6043]RYH08108.1 NUDIX hydrolase [Tropicimonas sp. IMCC6043]